MPLQFRTRIFGCATVGATLISFALIVTSLTKPWSVQTYTNDVGNTYPFLEMSPKRVVLWGDSSDGHAEQVFSWSDFDDFVCNNATLFGDDDLGTDDDTTACGSTDVAQVMFEYIAFPLSIAACAAHVIVALLSLVAWQLGCVEQRRNSWGWCTAITAKFPGVAMLVAVVGTWSTGDTAVYAVSDALSTQLPDGASLAFQAVSVPTGRGTALAGLVFAVLAVCLHLCILMIPALGHKRRAFLYRGNVATGAAGASYVNMGAPQPVPAQPVPTAQPVQGAYAYQAQPSQPPMAQQGGYGYGAPPQQGYMYAPPPAYGAPSASQQPPPYSAAPGGGQLPPPATAPQQPGFAQSKFG